MKNTFENDPHIIVDDLNRRFRILLPEDLSEPPENLQISRQTSPWKIYLSMLITVLPAFLLMNTIFLIVEGISQLSPNLILAGGLCSLPLIIVMFTIHRPKLIHLQIAALDENGANIHATPGGGSLHTIQKTTFRRFIIRDDEILLMPPSRQLWSLFILTILAAMLLTIFFAESVFLLIAAIFLWLIGFSLPVLAWWATSTNYISLPTKRREAEAWLIAGMASAFPAVIINSLIAPELIPSSSPQWLQDFLLMAIAAPFGEELSKFIAVAIFLPTIKGPRKGFQIGFTVGLGFALIENIQYIAFSFSGGIASATITILIRGIGSIPAHAVWTAISGTAIGWIATNQNFQTRMTRNFKPISEKAREFASNLGFDITQGNEILRTDMGDQSSDNTWWINPKSDESVIHNNSKLNTHLQNFFFEGEKNHSKQNKPILLSPKRVLPALGISIGGHSFWNGSLVLTESFLNSLNIDLFWINLCSLMWLVLLISSILLIARRLLGGIKSLNY